MIPGAQFPSRRCLDFDSTSGRWDGPGASYCGPAGKEVVLDLVIQATVHQVDEPVGVNVARRKHLLAQEAAGPTKGRSERTGTEELERCHIVTEQRDLDKHERHEHDKRRQPRSAGCTGCGCDRSRSQRHTSTAPGVSTLGRQQCCYRKGKFTNPHQAS